MTISNKDGSIQICIDFLDVKRACPKDDFPLPNIDTIVDLIVRHSMFSVMDGFFIYNQIKKTPKDQEKTTFTCACPFGLKNVRAAY